MNTQCPTAPPNKKEYITDIGKLLVAEHGKKKYYKPEEVKKVAVKKAATKNKRLQRMQDGLQDLEIWMSDIMRQGLASLEKDAYKTCEDIAKRMQDAQLKGVANRLRELPMMIGYSDNWIERVLAALGEIYLFAQAFKRIDTLPKDFQDQLKIEGGINVKKEELADKEKVKDEWLVLGKIEGTDPLNDRITFRRVWLWGNHTGQPALVLDFAFGLIKISTMLLTAIGEGALAHDYIDRLAMYRCIFGTIHYSHSYLVLEITEIRCGNSENECRH